MSELVPLALVRKIELALLEPAMNRQEVEAGCTQAITYDSCAVLVKPHYVELARKVLKETGIKVASVVGFPHGGVTTATKMYETQDIVQRGAEEISMVVNLGALRDGEDLLVHNDISTIVRAARGRPVTAILQSQYLNDEELLRACKIADTAGAAFLQVGTGFAPIQNTMQDIRLIRINSRLPVKGAGRIDSLDRAMEMLEIGVARVVASQTG